MAKSREELMDDLDFDKYGKVKCPKIEGMMPKLMKKLPIVIWPLVGF